MNKNIIILLTVISASSAWGQQENMRDSRGREKIRAAQAAYITERLQLTTTEAEKFWPLYREYSAKRSEIRQQLHEGRRSGADEKELLDLGLRIKQQELDLEKEYSIRFQQIISPEKLLKLGQAEEDFRKLILRQIQQRHRKRN